MKQRRKSNQTKLEKESCEICNLADKNVLHIHHIIPRCDPRCTNDNNNLAIVCSNCHNKIHTGEITIIGVYKATNANGRKLMFFHKGDEPPLPKEFWLIKDNDMVITRNSK